MMAGRKFRDVEWNETGHSAARPEAFEHRDLGFESRSRRGGVSASVIFRRAKAQSGL